MNIQPSTRRTQAINNSMASSSILYILFFLCATYSLATAAPEKDLVTSLPGFIGALPSKHYAGYVNIDENQGKNLFYYFVVSERNPSEDPVVLWLNGGPGCSSFDGFIYEHGPFNFEAGKEAGQLPKLHLNPHSWSKVSNIIYLDSPAGVGLSYSDNELDYITGDLKTATDSHAFLLKWFSLYPEFLQNDFFIAGESYAGVYVPTLAYEVAKGIKAGFSPTLNFKGYMVGNGVTDEVFDGNALVPFAHGMGLISDDLFQEAETTCLGSYWNYSQNGGDKCQEILDQIDGEIEGLNIYDILEPCYHSSEIKLQVDDNGKLPYSFRRLGETSKPFPVRKRMFGRAWPLRAPVKPGRVPTWPELGSNSVPCTDDEVSTIWMNDDTVRAAIHARKKNEVEWFLCTEKINFSHDAGSMIKYHVNLTLQGYRALIYSGDHDMCVPFTGSEAWTRSLGYQVEYLWRPWYFHNQVAGYTQGYVHGLTFLTVKGSGHTVPEYKPQEALAFYSRWLGGTSI